MDIPPAVFILGKTGVFFINHTVYNIIPFIFFGTCVPAIQNARNIGIQISVLQIMYRIILLTETVELPLTNSVLIIACAALIEFLYCIETICRLIRMNIPAEPQSFCNSVSECYLARYRRMNTIRADPVAHYHIFRACTYYISKFIRCSLNYLMNLLDSLEILVRCPFNRKYPYSRIRISRPYMFNIGFDTIVQIIETILIVITTYCYDVSD